MASLKLVIFDCDGVMFDSMEANRKYYNFLLEKFGHPLIFLESFPKKLKRSMHTG
jgi:beta-phosphoglucomutase-like phosphatase (HAD superfamily)